MNDCLCPGWLNAGGTLRARYMFVARDVDVGQLVAMAHTVALGTPTHTGAGSSRRMRRCGRGRALSRCVGCPTCHRKYKLYYKLSTCANDCVQHNKLCLQSAIADASLPPLLQATWLPCGGIAKRNALITTGVAARGQVGLQY